MNGKYILVPWECSDSEYERPIKAAYPIHSEAFDLERVLGNPLVGPAMWSAIQGEKSARAAMEEVKVPAQAILDELFHQ